MGRGTQGTGSRRKKRLPKYDSGYKHELSKQEQFIHFMQKYVKAKWADQLKPEQIRLCDREFLLEDYQKRQADLVYCIEMPERKFYIYLIMELQSSVDHTMPFRLLTLIYALQLRLFLITPKKKRERAGFRLPVVIPVLFYNGDQSWTVPQAYHDYQESAEFFGRYALNFEYYLVDLRRIENTYILNSNTLLDNILALDKNRENSNLPEILEKLIMRLNRLNQNERADFSKWLEYVLMASLKNKDQKKIQELTKALRKGDVEMIHGLQRTIMEQFDEGMRSGLRTGRKEGRREGRSEGKKQGIKALIETCAELECSREDTFARIQDKFKLSEKEAAGYMDQYWHGYQNEDKNTF